MVQVIDPAEETLPYNGRTEFLGSSGRETMGRRPGRSLCAPNIWRALQRIAPNSPEWRQRFGWSFLTHHTDRPASEPLLSLLMRLQGSASGYRWMSASSDAKARAP